MGLQDMKKICYALSFGLVLVLSACASTQKGEPVSTDALELAVAAWVRHNKTEYDEFLAGGSERLDAREVVRHKIREVMDQWKDLDARRQGKTNA